ncbi:hypothetical protein G6011_02344 [Alternaria panax]|uniref:X8 domain-containing protein n=1 Tax=Alternaria panax TaxID=48097 RepID=A0AAD4FEZ4_9PLEO|nr:hypothetical protein G6011_02344 [Alternaria panax]
MTSYRLELSNSHPPLLQLITTTPTNLPASYPELSSSWEVNSKALPPMPDRDLCECMQASISCALSRDLNTSDYDEVFGFICSERLSVCAGINTNTTTGVYGAYSMCNDTQKLTYVMDAYYLDQNSASTACDHDGAAEIRSFPRPTSSCKAKLNEVASNVTWAATATAS